MALCERFGISRKTGYKWLNRFRENGQAGLEPLSRRPKSMPRKTPDEVVDAVIALRRKHPDWSASRLHEMLEEQGIAPLPAPSTIDLILRRQREAVAAQQEMLGSETRRYEPNYRWQVRTGMPLKLADGGCFEALCVTDTNTDFVVGVTLLATAREESLAEYLAQLFRRHGLPWRVCLPADPSQRDAAPVRLHSALSVWLMRQGVGVDFGFVPSQSGVGSGSRRQLASRLAALPAYQRAPLEERAAPVDLLERFAAIAPGLAHEAAVAELENLRERHNFSGRHEAMQRREPISIYRPSPRKLPEVVPVPAYAPEAQVRLVSEKGTVTFQNRVVQIGRPFAGLEIEFKLTADPARFVVLFAGQLLGVVEVNAPAAGESNVLTLRPR